MAQLVYLAVHTMMKPYHSQPHAPSSSAQRNNVALLHELPLGVQPRSHTHTPHTAHLNVTLTPPLTASTLRQGLCLPRLVYLVAQSEGRHFSLSQVDRRMGEIYL